METIFITTNQVIAFLSITVLAVFFLVAFILELTKRQNLEEDLRMNEVAYFSQEDLVKSLSSKIERFEKRVKEDNEIIKELEKKYSIYFTDRESEILELNKLLMEESDLRKRKDKTIKYLSDRNIVLENECGNLPDKYIQASEVLKNSELQKAYERFISILQTSK